MNKEIIELIVKRLEMGAEKYGKENISSDGRNFTQEALEECLDMMVYICAKLIEIRKGEENA
tara:strand:+ start:484 stop:669 length:186 start_codon:yes stop_codon:yes gene_type:complete